MPCIGLPRLKRWPLLDRLVPGLRGFSPRHRDATAVHLQGQQPTLAKRQLLEHCGEVSGAVRQGAKVVVPPFGGLFGPGPRTQKALRKAPGISKSRMSIVRLGPLTCESRQTWQVAGLSRGRQGAGAAQGGAARLA